MNQVMTDIWPYLLPVFLMGITGLIGWVHNLRTRVAILENTVEKQQERLDSHSKKQDEVLVKMNSMERGTSSPSSRWRCSGKSATCHPTSAY